MCDITISNSCTESVVEYLKRFNNALYSAGFEDLLGKFEENNILADKPSHQPSLVSTATEDNADPFSFISNLDADRRKSDPTPPAKGNVL